MSDHLHTPATLLPEERTPVPIVYEASWAPEQVWMLWRRQHFAQTGTELTLAIQTVGHRYTD
jgi:hypothetical protein